MYKALIARMGLWLLISCMACSPIRIVNTEPAEDFNLRNYQTFAFYEVDGQGNAISQDYTQRVTLLKNAITKQLQVRGLTHNSTQPDLLVNLGIVVNEKVQTRPTNFQTDAPRYIGQRRYSWKSEQIEVGRYKEGTVTVHLVDQDQNKMVWRGVAQGLVPDKISKLEKTINEGAEKLFARLPAAGK